MDRHDSSYTEVTKRLFPTQGAVVHLIATTWATNGILDVSDANTQQGVFEQ